MKKINVFKYLKKNIIIIITIIITGVRICMGFHN